MFNIADGGFTGIGGGAMGRESYRLPDRGYQESGWMVILC